MTSIVGKNDFNNLYSALKKAEITQKLERLSGHRPLDLSYKKPINTDEILNCSRNQTNGKQGDFKYVSQISKSRPYLNYDAGFDPTILNAVRNKYVNVSGTLIPYKELPRKTNLNTTIKPFIPYGIII